MDVKDGNPVEVTISTLKEENTKLKSEVEDLKEINKSYLFEIDTWKDKVSTLETQFQLFNRNISTFQKAVANKFEEEGNKFGKKIAELEDRLKEKFVENNEDLLDVKDDVEASITEKFEETTYGLKELRKDFSKETIDIKQILMNSYYHDVDALDDTDSSHGALLQKMIENDCSEVEITAFASFMRVGAVFWRNPQKNYFCSLHLVRQKKWKWMETLLLKYVSNTSLINWDEIEEDLALGSYWPELSPTMKQQSELLINALTESCTKDVIEVLLKRVMPRVLEVPEVAKEVLKVAYSNGNRNIIKMLEAKCDSTCIDEMRDEVLGTHMPESATIDDYGLKLHDLLIDQAPIETLLFFIENTSPEILTWKHPRTKQDALDCALRNRDDPKVWTAISGLDDVNATCELKKYMPIKTIVKAGRDWPNVTIYPTGTVTKRIGAGVFQVQWDGGYMSISNFGFKNKYEIAVLA